MCLPIKSQDLSSAVPCASSPISAVKIKNSIKKIEKGKNAFSLMGQTHFQPNTLLPFCFTPPPISETPL